MEQATFQANRCTISKLLLPLVFCFFKYYGKRKRKRSDSVIYMKKPIQATPTQKSKKSKNDYTKSTKRLRLHNHCGRT